MSWPRPKLTIRGTMVLVGVLAAASFGVREALEGWRAAYYRSPAMGSTLKATTAERRMILPEDRRVPVSVQYDFRFSAGSPPAGTSALLLAVISFKEIATGHIVSDYTFDVALHAGGRERATEEFRWDAVVPRPGRYQLWQRLYGVGPSGDVQYLGGSGMSREFVPPEGPAADRRESP